MQEVLFKQSIQQVMCKRYCSGGTIQEALFRRYCSRGTVQEVMFKCSCLSIRVQMLNVQRVQWFNVSMA